MKIGIDARLINETGVGRYTRNLLQYLQKIDTRNEYTLFIREPYPQKVGTNWKIVYANTRWHTLEEQLIFTNILEKENLDLVHFPYFSVPVRYSRPFVVTIHDLILHHFPTGEASTLPYPLYLFKLAAYRYVMKHAAVHAEKIIAVSEATKHEIVDHLSVPSGKVIVTYEGIDTALMGRQKHLSNMLDKIPYFLYVGNAYPHKNIDVLLEAFKNFLGKGHTSDLILVGKPDYFYNRVQKKIEALGLQGHVRCFGEAGDKELVDLYRHARALVIPSLMEGFGLPAVEALANECLVIASAIPSLKEVCADAALYFTPTHPEELARCLAEVETKPRESFQSLRVAGKKILKRYSWQKMAEETKRIYESCARV